MGKWLTKKYLFSLRQIKVLFTIFIQTLIVCISCAFLPKFKFFLLNGIYNLDNGGREVLAVILQYFYRTVLRSNVAVFANHTSFFEQSWHSFGSKDIYWGLMVSETSMSLQLEAPSPFVFNVPVSPDLVRIPPKRNPVSSFFKGVF